MMGTETPSLFDQIKLLYEYQLYSNLSTLAGLLLSATEKNNELLNSSQKCQLMIYYGNSLYQCNEYRRAEAMLRRALQFKKTLSKTKGGVKTENCLEITSEVEIKYQIHLCHVALRQLSLAVGVLESIPAKQRGPKVNMALASLYHATGMERSASTGYKEVIKECPLALEAALGLLSLGTKVSELDSLMISHSTTLSKLEWLGPWLTGHAYFYAGDYNHCISTLSKLDDRQVIKDNTDTLVSIGTAYSYLGDTKNALATLQRVHTLDSLNLKGMDILAGLLAYEKKQRELEKLAGHLINLSDAKPEPYIALACFCRATKKCARAVHFAHKAIVLNPRSVVGLVLKGALLLDLKKIEESVIHFREALQISPQCYEAHRGLVDAYIALVRMRDAATAASTACKQLGQTPRALALYASVLRSDILTVARARSVLERAIQQDPLHLPSIYMLVEVYEQDRMYEAAIDLLKRTLSIQSTCKLHQMLADLLAMINEKDKAFEHYNKALNLDPNNSRALEGIQRLEQASDNIDGSYDVDDTVESENEGDVEESETEALWSDIDLGLNTV